MNLYSKKSIRFEDEEETPKELPDNPMEKMQRILPHAYCISKPLILERKLPFTLIVRVE